MIYSNQLALAGVPSFDLGVCRSEDFNSPTMDFHELDLTGAALECVVSLYPGAEERVASLVVSKTIETNTYQNLVDECRYQAEWLPCGKALTDTVKTTVINITSAQTAFANLPKSENNIEGVQLYYALRQTTPDQNVILAGNFHVTETAQ